MAKEETRGRKRHGTLIHKSSGWRARITVDTDAGPVRRVLDLGTTNKGVARRKLNQLLRNVAAGSVTNATADAAATRVTVSLFAEEHYARREKLGVKTWKDEERWFKRHIEPHIGSRALEEIESTDITDLLTAAVDAGRPMESVKKIRVECARLFTAARKAKLIAASPVDDADSPKMHERKKPRTLVSDPEFVQYVTHPHPAPGKKWLAKLGLVDFEIKVRAIIARTIGGARTSDENALDWSTTDLVDFASIVMFRPKTGDEDVYIVPDVARPFLREWWEREGQKTKGPIFPIRKGKRAGERRGKDSFAHRFRRDLLTAGVNRFELHNDTDRTLRTDFHSFRRAFSTAVRRAKVEARDAMRLTAHTSYETHQRYVQEDGPIAPPPDAALPALPPANDTRSNYGTTRDAIDENAANRGELLDNFAIVVANDDARLAASGMLWVPAVAGSNPATPTADFSLTPPLFSHGLVTKKESAATRAFRAASWTWFARQGAA